MKWNQAGKGNAHVSDGLEGFWTTTNLDALAVLDAFLSTADYDNAATSFTVTATILSGPHAGDCACRQVIP